VRESIERIREAGCGYPELNILAEYKAAPLITIGEECTQPQECRECMETCAPKVFVLAPDAKLVSHTKYPLIRVGWENRTHKAMRIIAAEPTVCTVCMACVRVCPLHCVTIEMPSK
jgi:NAD-dependent dihydropyrimidine dehydrogenase PreA subunit